MGKPYLKYMFSLAWRQKNKVLLLLLLALLETGVRLVQPYFQKIIVDTLTNGLVSQIFTQAQIQLMFTIIVAWFIFAVINNILHAYGNHTVWQIGNVSSQWVHVDGFRKLLKLDYYKHTQKHSSRYAKLIDEADVSMWEMSNWWLGRFFYGALGFVAMLIIAFSISWQMTLISLSVIPPGLGIIIFMMNRYDEEQRRVNKLWNAKHEHLSDQVANIITYKLNQDEQLFVDVQKGYSDRGYNAQSALNKKWRLVEMLNPDAIARFLVMGMGVLLVKDHAITLGTLFMFMGLINEILVPLHLLGDILPQYSRRARHIDRILQLFDERDEVFDPLKPLELKKVEGKIEFRNVSFGYGRKNSQSDNLQSGNSRPDGAQPDEVQPDEARDLTIRELSFVMAPGHHLALVGHSGAGKSTIMALMTRLLDPTSGTVLLDDVDIRRFRQDEYRALIGTVLQENSLYNETVAQNIAYGKPSATREEIIRAARMAAADEFILKLPKGFDTLIGERGVRLSGGEKQRLAIARAMLKDPKIVILDEPTSALDSITEAKVQKGLQSLIEGRTALVIAHRLATVRSADKILLLRDGKLLALGTHAELMHTSTEYQQMVELQTGGFLADE